MQLLNLRELLDELASRQAIIVHFSHHANMREGGVFPLDLQDAITNRSRWTLSCCVLWPDHSMDLPGDVGIVFVPTDLSQIISVSKTDSGSSQLACGEENSGGSTLERESLNESFEVTPGDYNEWRVRGANPVGLFVARKDFVEVKQQISLPGLVGEQVIALTRIPVPDIRALFPHLPLVAMTSSGPIEIASNALPQTIETDPSRITP